MSCKKDELPQSQIGKPEFVSQFNFNGEQYSMVIGENGLVQTSEFDTSETGIVLSGFTVAGDCNGCGPAFTVIIESPFDFVYTNGQNMVQELNNWDYALNVDSISYMLTMEGLLAGGNPFGNWFLNGSPVQPIGDTLQLEISEPGNYTVEYVVNEPSCQASTTRNFDFDGVTVPCYGDIIQSFNSPNTFNAYPAFPFIPEEMSYFWSYGDSVFFTGNIDSFIFPPGALNSEVCVEMINGQGCSTTACYSADTDASGLCSADIFLHSAQIVETIPTSFSANLILEFTDNAGVNYTSDGGNQDASIITIISIDSYVEPTMPDKNFAKMEVSISCTLYDNNGNGYPFSGILQTAFEFP